MSLDETIAFDTMQFNNGDATWRTVELTDEEEASVIARLFAYTGAANVEAQNLPLNFLWIQWEIYYAVLFLFLFFSIK